MRHDERGSALLITLLLMVAMAVLGATFLSGSLTDRKIATNETDAAKAFAIAEAGIEDARVQLGSANVNTLLAAGGHLSVNTSVGGGSYSVDVTNNVNPHTPTFTSTTVVPVDAGGISNDTDRILVLNSTGTFRKASRRIEIVVNRPQTLFNYGVWCNTGGTFSGSSYLDSYNSALGPYGGGNVGSNAGLFCNSSMTLSGSAQVRGDCTIGDTSCTGGGGVTGTRTPNAPTQTRTAPTCPAGAFTAAADVPEPSTYNAGTGVLRSDGVLTFTVPPTTYYFSDVTVSGSNSIAFNNPGGLHVDIYISGKATVSGGSFVNPTNATKLGLWACGPGTSDWTISGGSDARFTLYAPTRKVTLSGGSPFFGSITGKQVENTGGSAIHYDTSLASGGNAGLVARTWREIFP